MSIFEAEFLGTLVLMLLGNGVVANVTLTGTKGHGAGLIIITAGWGAAVFMGIVIAGDASGAHLNPAVTAALALTGGIRGADIPAYLGGQVLGAAAGTTLVWMMYRSHFDATTDQDTKRGCFCNTPAIPHTFRNLLSEALGTAVLVLVVLYKGTPEYGLGAVDALPVGLTVFGIGMSLGGTTGYAINPARDLIPRIMHAVLPIAGKGGSDWGYAWIPVIGPLLGAVAAVAVHGLL